MIVVKLIKLGQPIQDYSLDDCATLGELLDLAGEEFFENTITINNSPVSRGTTLHDNDRIFIGRAMKGNLPFEVQVIRLGSRDGIINLPADDGFTIDQVLQQLPTDERGQFFGSDGKALYEYRIGGGQPISGSYVLSRPASGTIRLLLSTRTKGN